MNIFSKLSWFIKAEWKRYLIGISDLLFLAILHIFPPLIIGMIVDELNKHTLTWQTLLFQVFLILLLTLIDYGMRFIWRYALFGGAAKLEQTLRGRLFHHYLKMDEKFFQKYRVGDLMAHATNDISAVQQVVGGGVLSLVDAIVTGLTTIFAMIFIVSPKLTALTLIPMPFLAWTAFVLGKWMHKAYDHYQASFSRLDDKAQESMSGIKVIKSLGQEKEDFDDFAGLTQKSYRAARKIFYIDPLFDLSAQLFIGMTYVLTIFIGGGMVAAGSLSVGKLVSYFSYILNLTWPMFAIGQIFNIMERGDASYDRINFLMHEKSSIIESMHDDQKIPNGDLSYQIKSFEYPDDQDPALTNVKFDVKQGQMLGIVGPVGSGKSSIIKLLLRTFDEYDGEIVYSSKNIKEYSLDSYLHAIGYVPQDNFLFTSTIGENIKFARYDASISEIKQAAQIADIDRDIENFPKKYDTMVGQRGVSLSGGQQQRIAIARALITDPDILILDDALSAVDALTEKNILHNLKHERNGKTTVILAQRLSSVMDANEIIVMGSGSIVERGTHEELLALKGWYFDTWNKQESDRMGGLTDG
ncbi:ABC transporter ATP-binding protein [Xylocopilactobacillus apicola]|uniref:Multidrug ABC transporter permease/ATP-binding protein n=1 Tax=Xylocopilactobacillus apicola TaxID=2932184 RepID=A0AAU9D9M5_9LACO|nr:ABC transporter transmembrane domain-containing protein [Xylocopilactobacillus apicola]BDR58195.1 multidrug ABC transporter permease/ATP-binding protein [Xylocopilactobacillus apicola]